VPDATCGPTRFECTLLDFFPHPIQKEKALIAVLVIRYLQFHSDFRWAVSNLVALLRWNLFSYRNLSEWLNRPFNRPFDTPPEPQPKSSSS